MFVWKMDHLAGWMSEWYESHFVVEGERFVSVVQYVTYRKACLFGDRRVARQVLNAVDKQAADHVSMGRLVRGYTRSDWKRHAVEIVM